MHDFTKLRVWVRASELAIAVHHALKGRDMTGAPGLASQLIRASASIAANIAEGAGQESPAQFARFLSISIGSASEVENYLIHAAGIGLITQQEADPLLAMVREARRMLHGLRKSVRRTGARRV